MQSLLRNIPIEYRIVELVLNAPNVEKYLGEMIPSQMPGGEK